MTVPDFPEYGGDLQPAAWYEKFYRHHVSVGAGHAAVTLRDFVLAVQQMPGDPLPDGELLAYGWRYRVVGYHVRQKSLLLERV